MDKSKRTKVQVIAEGHWTRVLELKCIKLFTTLDQLISRNLLAAGVETRPVKTNGLWCCVLLPAVLCMYTLLYEVSLLYKIAAAVSIGLVFYSVLFVLFLSVSCVVVKEPAYGGCTASGMVSVLILYVFLGQDFITSVMFSLPTLFLYNMLLKTCLVSHPKTFTVGEAMIVSQGIALFCITMAIRMFFPIEEYDEEIQFISTIIDTVLTTVGLMVAVLYFLYDEQRTLATLIKIFTAGASFCLTVLHYTIGVGFLPKIIMYIFFTGKRLQMFMFWLALLAGAVLALVLRAQLAVKANTVTRKTFHVLASLVYMSGILVDVNLITLASGLALAAVILTEALRKAKIEPISSALQSAFDVFSDEKDAGSFAMTPLYLFCALSSPLLLVPPHAGAALERLAGVLAIGVGDTAASWVGSNYGFYKWKSDSNRTLEGTTFNILSQIMTVYALQLFELLTVQHALVRTCVSAVASGLVEAHTDQVDNLVLPLVSLLAFQATFILC